MFRISKEERLKANRKLREKIIESVVDIQKNTTIKVFIEDGNIRIDNPTSIKLEVLIK